jgi:UDP-N-acetylmuramyl pentapeptide synthase
VAAHAKAGDLVLVKGSRSIGTEKIVQALAAERGRRA